MRKIISLLAAYLSFGFVGAGPLPSTRDIAAGTNPTWSLTKRAIIDGKRPDTLFKRTWNVRDLFAPGPISPDPNAIPPYPHTGYHRSDSLSSTGSESSFSPSESDSALSSPSQSPPSTPARTTTQPQHVHGDGHFRAPWIDGRIARWEPFSRDMWMKSPGRIRFGKDRGTKEFLKKGNIDRTFPWAIGVCDILQSLDCYSATIAMKKYPGKNLANPYYAEVSKMDHPIRESGNRVSRMATIDHLGRVRVPPQEGDILRDWRLVWQKNLEAANRFRNGVRNTYGSPS